MIQISSDANHILRLRMRRPTCCLRDGCCSVGALEAERVRPCRALEDIGDQDSIVPGRDAMDGTPNGGWGQVDPRDRSWGSKDDSFPREASGATTYGDSGRQDLGVGRSPDEGVLRGGHWSARPGMQTEIECGERFTLINRWMAAGSTNLRSPMRCGSRGRNVAVNTTKNDNMQNQLDHRDFLAGTAQPAQRSTGLREVRIDNQHDAFRRNDGMRRQRLGRRPQKCDLVIAAPATSGEVANRDGWATSGNRGGARY